MRRSSMSSGRKVADEKEARRCLLKARRGGLSAGEWGRRHGIDGRSLHAWQVNLERRGTKVAPRRRERKAASAKAALVELVPAVREVAAAATARYALEVGGARLEFGDDVSAVTLRR